MKEITDYLLTLGWNIGKCYDGEVETGSQSNDYRVRCFEDGWELFKSSDRDDDDGVAQGYWNLIAEGDTLDELKSALGLKP